MKLGDAAKRSTSSFGIPPEIDPRIQQPARPPRPEDVEKEPEKSVDDSYDLAKVPGEEKPETTEKQETALSQLQEMGLVLSGDDWSGLFYKGFVEKEMKLGDIPNPETKKLTPFKVTVRTLTTEDYDLADTLLAEEVRSVNMTNQGLENRRQLWYFTMALQKINGMPVCSPVTKQNPDTKKDEIDAIATAKKKRAILSKFSTHIVNIGSAKYWRFDSLVRALMEDPNQIFLGKP